MRHGQTTWRVTTHHNRPPYIVIPQVITVTCANGMVQATVTRGRGEEGHTRAYTCSEVSVIPLTCKKGEGAPRLRTSE